MDSLGGQTGQTPDTRGPKGGALVSAATKILKELSDKDVQVLGLTGERLGSGVSLLTHEVAAVARSLGLACLIVDASNGMMFEDEPVAVAGSIPDAEQLSLGGMKNSDLEHPEARKKYDVDDIKSLFARRSGEFDLILVDLPPVCSGDNGSNPLFLKWANACDAIYLVCLTGLVSQKSLGYISRMCAIAELPLSGLILNDYKLCGGKLFQLT